MTKSRLTYTGKKSKLETTSKIPAYGIGVVEIQHTVDANGNETVLAVTQDSFNPDNPDNIPLWHTTWRTTIR